MINRLAFLGRISGVRACNPMDESGTIPLPDDGFIPASNEPSDCLQAFGDCREGQIPRPLGRFNLDAPLLAAGYLIMRMLY